MKKENISKVFALVIMLMSSGAFAQASPIGLWKVIDDKTKKPLTYVRISEVGGVLNGKMEKLLDAARQDEKCNKCTDERKDQPMLNMTILRNVKPAGGDAWEGGDILDPNNGKVYSVRLKPLDDGKVLEVRGYIGPFFRNQRWLRVE